MNTTKSANYDFFFLGSSHGAKAALFSLQQSFDRIEVYSADKEVCCMARPNDAVVESLDEIKSRSGVMAGYLEFLSNSFLENRQVVNIHYSLLPKYRGLHSVVWAILNLESELGLTYHMVNDNIDDGPIIYQHAIKNVGQTSAEFMQTLNDHVKETLGEVMQKWKKGTLCSKEQDKNKATWVPRRNLDDCLINFEWSAQRLEAFFQALVRPYPLPSLQIRGKRYGIKESKIIDRPYFCDSGRVVNIDSDGVWIKCADSLLLVSKLVDDQDRDHDAQGLFKLGMRLD
ncbi:formyltransferase family protein [Verrucomicrobia bacterium]|nr:formyltransferase family protein [Verrucomicrobiota bacterium]